MPVTFNLYQKRGRYGVVCYDKSRTPKRKYLSLGTGDKVTAQQALARMQRDHAFGKFDLWAASISDKGLVVSEAVEAFLKDRAHLSPHTLRGYNGVLGLFDRFLPVATLVRSITPAHIDAFIRSRKINRTSQKSYHRTLKVFFSWLVEVGYLEDTPIDGTHNPKAPHNPAPFLSRDEARRVLAVMEQEWLSDLVRFALCTGLRRGELLNLRWRFVDLTAADGWITVQSYSGFTTKSGHGRRVPLVPEARRVLEERYALGYSPEALVFSDDQSRPIAGDRASKAFKKAVRLAKLDEALHFHSLRHTFASWLVMEGVSLPIVANLLGHSTTQVTERYSHLLPDSVANPMQRVLGSISFGRRPEVPVIQEAELLAAE